MTNIHTTAIVDPEAKIADDVLVGPYSCIGPNVVIREGVVIHSHVVITGETTIGKHCEIFSFSSIGGRPQDLKHNPNDTSPLVIGDHCLIREGVTINGGTQKDNNLTKIGSHNVFLMYSHVGHDCVIGDHCILSNQVLLGGHVKLGSYVGIGGGSAVHQFVEIGDHVFVGGLTPIIKNIPPFAFCHGIGQPLTIFGLNIVGLRRRSIPTKSIQSLNRAYALFFEQSKHLLLKEKIAALNQTFEQEAKEDPHLQTLLDFFKTERKRPLCTRFRPHESDEQEHETETK